jgi:RES domain-containing protein
MTVRLWRIATDTPDYTADDRSGAGAKVTGGRWNRKGTAMLYTASSLSLACLETLVHLNSLGLPLNRYVVRFDVPDALWQAAEVFLAAGFVGWDALPPGAVSLDFGDQWAREVRSALLRVPSTIVEEEENVLVNPLHPDFAQVVVTKVRRFLYDARFRAVS